MQKKILKILLLIFSLILVVFVTFIIINKKANNNNNDNNNDTETNDIVLFNTEGSEKLFTIDSVNKINDNNQDYIKIGITLNNNTDIDILMNKYLFKLVDKSIHDDNTIIANNDENDDSNELVENVCYFNAYGNLTFDDMFAEIAKANEITKGYLYCLYNDLDYHYLKMSYVIENSNRDEIEIKLGHYFFELN